LNLDPVASELSGELPVRPPSARTSSLSRSTSAKSEASEGESTASKYVKDFVLNDLLFVFFVRWNIPGADAAYI
jgi:hypothetical protein